MHDNMKQLKRFTLQTLFSKELISNYFERLYMMNRYRLNGGTHFIAISKDAYDFSKEVAPEFDVTLLHNAVNLEKFKPVDLDRKKLNEKIRIVNVGSFQTKKNQPLLVLIGEELLKRGVDFEIHFLGDGSTKAGVEEMVNHKKLEGHVHFHGMIENVEEYFWEADVYVHTATYEPFGLVLIEAMAAGLPVVSLDGKGNRDLIEEGKNGYMIYEQTPSLFADKIIALAQNK